MKVKFLKYSLFFLILFSGLITYAQDDPPKIYGCHMHIHQDVPIPGYRSPMADYDVRSDSIDILDYHIRVDVSTFNYINAHTTVTGKIIEDGVDGVVLDLLNMNIDSVLLNGEKVEYTYVGFKLGIDFGGSINVNDDFYVDVYYYGKPTIDPSNFGGLAFDTDYIYNLGIGLSSDPHNYGRSWFPCFDNFQERSTYTYEVTHKDDEIAHCVGTDLGTIDNGDGTKTTIYQMSQIIPTYLSSIAVSNYETIWSEYDGVEATFPIKLCSKPEDIVDMESSFSHLPAAIQTFEDWYGPYLWERVGYVITTVGAMEHPTNTAYPGFSILGGNAENNTRLMAHELAHNWWGNKVTLTTEADMWIKEGNSEYGAHLVYETLYDKSTFLDVVKTNHAKVLREAHVDDNGFRALSGMPNAYTYGTTTYNKGASVIHNLRGYMGDEDFKIGQRSILEAYKYGHLDAKQYQAQLELATGRDMQPFFDAWIYAPGFSVYVVDSIQEKESQNTVYFQQKLYGTNKFHEDVPVTLDIIGENGENTQQLVRLNGKYDSAPVNVNYPIKRVIINRENLLNIARTDDEKIADKAGEVKFARTGITMNIKELENPFWSRVEHIYGAPDSHIMDGTNYRVSDSHYWNIDGDFDESNEIKVRFKYDGSSEYDLDYNLTNMTEDSLLLFYRRDASEAWLPFENAVQIKQIPTDGVGIYKIDQLIPGQYCFGNGEHIVAVENPVITTESYIYPNPSNEHVFISWVSQDVMASIELIDILGHTVKNIELMGEYEYYDLSISNLQAGTYFVQLRDIKGHLSVNERLIIQR